LRKQKIQADLILSSPATRAKQTINLVLKSARLKLEPKFEERIYEASGRSLLKLLTEIEDAVTSVIMVGHNPGFEVLLQLLTGEERRLPTASLTCIEFDVEQWSKVRAQSGNLKWRVTPKKLKSAASSQA
jgi:phosphohistidine phosphatase